jgi:N6-L-threonylcarbamoyladenine synthase
MMIIGRVKRLLADTGLTTLVVGGGVAANSLLRKECSKLSGVSVIFPSMKLCTDNGAMIAGIGYHYLKDGVISDLSLNAQARVPIFRKTYP